MWWRWSPEVQSALIGYLLGVATWLIVPLQAC
jgi:hypothetical protein